MFSINYVLFLWFQKQFNVIVYLQVYLSFMYQQEIQIFAQHYSIRCYFCPLVRVLFEANLKRFLTNLQKIKYAVKNTACLCSIIFQSYKMELVPRKSLQPLFDVDDIHTNAQTNLQNISFLMPCQQNNVLVYNVTIQMQLCVQKFRKQVV